jgi:type I restriction enzyme S subunit
MAIRARLSPSREAQTHWNWHKAKFLALPASTLWGGERRMEAENYLSSGYGHRLALQARLGGSSRLGHLARVWQPSRLKGITVSAEYGTPFLAATQAFDLRPVPRKFLSLGRTDNSAERFAKPGCIIVTCSGTVGRTTLATSAVSNVLLSHDLLRVEPLDAEMKGWTYAYLRAPSPPISLRYRCPSRAKRSRQR